MGGETDLDRLLSGLTAKLQPGRFVFATLAPDAVPRGIKPRMRFEESEGSTLILHEEDATKHGIKYEFPCRMITLEVHSALEAVGFIAHISTALAQAGMGVNPVAGFYHDHLFVPDGREEDALQCLERIRAEAQLRASK